MNDEYPGISVTHDSVMGDFQARFKASFPFLMIEFFHRLEGLRSMRDEKPDPGTRLAPRLTGPHFVVISGDRAVSAVVEELSSLTGMGVRICRKCGAVWNEIRLTGSWSLDRQNSAGEYITGIMSEPE
jgi:hypothetical protein